MKDNPTPRRKSYTQSFARDCKDLLVLSMPGVGNVGDFKKTFFGGGEGEGFRKNRNIGLLCIKPPYF